MKGCLCFYQQNGTPISSKGAEHGYGSTYAEGRTSNLPIRGVSREWAKILFSVASVSRWCNNDPHGSHQEQYSVKGFGING